MKHGKFYWAAYKNILPSAVISLLLFLLNNDLPVQVCDATNDAMRFYRQAHKKIYKHCTALNNFGK